MTKNKGSDSANSHVGSVAQSCAAKAPGAAAAGGAKPAQPLVTAPLKDPLAQGFKATAVIGISCKVRRPGTDRVV